MSAPERTADDLSHIVEAVDRIERYTSGMDLEVFANDELVRDAVLRNLANK